MNFTAIIALGFIFLLSLPAMIMAIYLIPLILFSLILLVILSMGITYILGKIGTLYSRWRLINDSKQPSAKVIKAIKGNFNSLQLQNATMDRMVLHHSKFNRANLSNINAKNSQLQFSSFRNTILKRANCYRSNFGHSDLSFANISKANLSYINLKSSTLIKSNFNNSNLTQSNLSNANAKNSWFTSADLSFSNLKGAKFQGANFCGANLSGCYVQETDFKDAFFNHKTKLPFGFDTAIKKGMHYIPRKKNKIAYAKIIQLDPIPRHVKMTSRYGAF